MRLIDGDELIKWIEDRYEITWEDDTYEGGIKDACSDMLEKIDNMPTIEPERTGKWIYEPAYDWHRCGACKKVYSNVLMEHFNECQYQPRFNYCPNCGARMES